MGQPRFFIYGPDFPREVIQDTVREEISKLYVKGVNLSVLPIDKNASQYVHV